jgi:outer membrane receptor protein involved in Fe transport
MKARTLLLTTTAALLVGGGAHAEDAAAARPAAASEPAAEVGELIVTAQRRSERLQDVPVSVSVATGETLARQGVSSTTDLSARMPNLLVTRTGPADEIAIRGTGSGLNGGFEQSVATFVDDVYRSRARALNVSLFDIDRVEVLKGPQTLFFGANAIAGALNITTKRPGRTREANALALYSPSDGEYALEGGATMPLSDTLSARLSARFSGMTDGYIHNPRGGDGPIDHNGQGRLSVAWDPTDKFSVFARYDIARERGEGSYNGLIVNCPPVGLANTGICTTVKPGQIDNKLDYNAVGALSGRFRLDMDEGLVTGRYAFSGADLISTTAYIHQYTRAASDTAEFPGTTVNGTSTFVPVNPGEYYDQISQEVRLQSNTSGRLKYMVGVYFEHNHLTNDVLSGLYFSNLQPLVSAFYPPQTPFGIHWLTRQTTDTWSAFGSVSYDITDQLSATVGVRYTNVDKQAHRVVDVGSGDRFYLADDNFVPAPAPAEAILAKALGQNLGDFANPSRTDTRLMPSANVQYKFTPDLMAYASYTTGFKAGGYGYVSADTFAPEYVTAYELGFKSTWLEHRATANVALFWDDYKNLQLASNFTTSAGVPITIIGNAARSRSRGVEFGGAFRATEDLTLSADLAYLDAKFTSYKTAPCSPYQAAAVPPPCIGDLSGHPPPFAPEWSGNVNGDYRRPVSDRLDLTAGGTVYFKSSYFFEPSSSPFLEEPAHTFLDLRAGVSAHDNSWDVSLIGKNVTDVFSAARRTFTSGSAGAVTVVPNRPASVAIQLRARY